jgi:D-alanyl-D-alanine dipeptidase
MESCIPDRNVITLNDFKTFSSTKKQYTENSDTSEFEKYLLSHDLINICILDTSIQVSLHYATKSNFLRKEMYPNFNACYLPIDVAQKLANAQSILKSAYPEYSIIVFDAVRPLSIQQEMWDELNLSVNEKSKYLTNPNEISLHNYGAAVDVGIIGKNGVLLDMGTEFDYFGELSEPKLEKKFYDEGKLSTSVLLNRFILREVMTKAGFTSITSEWWHFNSTSREQAKLKYKLVN